MKDSRKQFLVALILTAFAISLLVWQITREKPYDAFTTSAMIDQVNGNSIVLYFETGNFFRQGRVNDKTLVFRKDQLGNLSPDTMSSVIKSDHVSIESRDNLSKEGFLLDKIVILPGKPETEY